MDGLDDAGALVTGGIAAREVARAADGHGPGTHGAGKDDAHHLHGSACANCGAPVATAYCATCGQAAHLHRDITGFAHDVLHGVFHFDGKFWTTLPMLAFRPGQLTRRYIDGERQKFVTPMAMFLFSVFLMFAVVSNLPGWIDPGNIAAPSSADLDSVRREIGDALRDGDARLAALRDERARPGADIAELDRRIQQAERELAGLRTGARFVPGGDDASPHVTARVAGADAATNDATSAWFEEKVAQARANPKLLIYKMKSAGYKYSWALIPMSLPFLWVMFAWRRRFGLYDHAVFATYSIAFMSLLVVALTVVGYVLGGTGRTIAWVLLFLVPPVHMYKQLRHGYELRRFSAAWRTAGLLQVVSLTSVSFFLLLLYLGLGD